MSTVSSMRFSGIPVSERMHQSSALPLKMAESADGSDGADASADCFVPSEQLCAEAKHSGNTPVMSEVKKFEQAVLKTVRDFLKAPLNIYLHKKSTDAAIEGDLDKAGKMEDRKAEFNAVRRQQPARTGK